MKEASTEPEAKLVELPASSAQLAREPRGWGRRADGLGRPTFGDHKLHLRAASLLLELEGR